MLRREFLCGPFRAINELGLTSVHMCDQLGSVHGFVSWFSLDFLTFSGLSDIHRVRRSLGTPLFAIQ
jgi:hypothetical protein